MSHLEKLQKGCGHYVSQKNDTMLDRKEERKRRRKHGESKE